MSIHVALRHITRYKYDHLINLGPQVVRLRPAPHCRTRILSYSMQVSPATHFINWQQDPQSNYLARLVFPERTDHFEVAIDLVAEMSVLNPFDFFLEDSAQEVPFKYDKGLDHELAPYLQACKTGAKFETFFKALNIKAKRTVDFLVELNQKVYNHIDYTIRLEPGVQTPDETLTKQSGSCRDSAWLLVQLLRRMGMAARFASGYLIQLTADVKAVDGPNGPEADFTDLHAWCEVYLPGAGWIGLDPTSGLLAGEGHIPLACSPDPTSAAPISGLVDECEVEFEHEMSVSRIFESPRTSKPYTEAQWADIQALGFKVDAALDEGDVRLTMGGEPTFVADRDRSGAEWNTDAMGPTKRGYGVSLLNRLFNHYGEGGLLHFGQGKWYPGEQLPRWALSLYWRKDGQPLWRDRSLFGDDTQLANPAATHHTAETLLKKVGERLGLTAEYMMPGFEDAWYYLWRERKLPANVDPFESKLEDPLERARLHKVFDDGLSSPVGYCLPLGKRHGAWTTGPWFLRSERMYLIPGDSPMGYRLPLDSQPWVTKKDFPYLIPADPFSAESQAPLPDADDLRQRWSGVQGQYVGAPSTQYMASRTVLQTAQLTGQMTALSQFAKTGEAAAPSSLSEDIQWLRQVPKHLQSAHWIVRTAICTQVRNGHLYVFMPPTERLEDYLEVVTAVESVAEEMKQRVILEGYPPPRDTRLTVLQVTPDPGVLEVNVHPSKTWGELLQLTETLYEEAHQTLLSTEKFMLDGRHCGTGGGNHFVMGGETPADSPFLRRPDLLGSMIRYWINHPGLSYLFSGLFIGPTSQSPRVDEARSDQVHELELALHELDRQTKNHNGHPPLWMIDRLLRNIMVDATGNTHRCEFSIDKLYSPDSPSGRLGLLELRAFEMPPHYRMSMTQQLLLRALIAKFWKQPYTAPLVKWGTRLHDQFMLSNFVEQDVADVVADLNQAGFEFKMDWFAPHLAFRFPKIGDLSSRGLHLDIHQALEPWHVLGEEGTAGGTVRYVDSSLERLELRVKNHVDGRYVITCNGNPVPLHPTGRQGEYVAGIRYRAWQPASALHPTIGVNAPLRIEVYDSWNGRSLGGCEYHVAHPGGRNYDVFPINAFEAESRRLSRFFRMGHTQGQFETSRVLTRSEFPMTMDLRWL